MNNDQLYFICLHFATKSLTIYRSNRYKLLLYRVPSWRVPGFAECKLLKFIMSDDSGVDAVRNVKFLIFYTRWNCISRFNSYSAKWCLIWPWWLMCTNALQCLHCWIIKALFSFCVSVCRGYPEMMSIPLRI